MRSRSAGRHNRAGRIGRRVQDDDLRLWRYRFFDGLGRDAEVLRLLRVQEDDLAPCILNDVLERHPVGHRQNHLIAMVYQHLDGIEERQFAAGREDGFINSVVGTKVGRMAIHDRFANFRNTGHHRVAREVAFDRGNRGILDMARRGEVRLARAKIYQLYTLRTQLGCLRGHRHCGRHFNAADAVGKNLAGVRGEGGAGCRRDGRSAHSSIVSDFANSTKIRLSLYARVISSVYIKGSMRILVDIPDLKIKALTLMSKQRRVSRAALVREAVSAYIDANSHAEKHAAREAAFGLWKRRGVDGLEYQKKIRAEWDDR